MPVKGDDFDAAIADATIEHLGNTTARFTEKGLVHPGPNSIDVRGIFTRLKTEASGYLSFLPAFSFKTGSMVDPITLALVTPTKGSQVTIDSGFYTVVEMEVESTDMTRLILETTPT